MPPGTLLCCLSPLPKLSRAGAALVWAARPSWGCAVPGWRWQRMLTQPIAAASPPRGPQHWKGWLGDSTLRSVLQIWMHRINSCRVWVTEQRYPCGGSYSTYPAVNTNQLAELEGQAGPSSALAPLSVHFERASPKCYLGSTWKSTSNSCNK